MISLLIASRGRCCSLRRTLDSLYALGPPPCPTELVMVASGCPLTASMVQQEKPPEWLIYKPISVEAPGKSRAVNQAMSRSTGDYWVFTDDDVDFEPGFFEQLLAGFQATEAAGLQGGVTTVVQGDLPRWWTPHCAGLLADTQGYPEKPTELSTCNAVLAREAALRAGPWPEHFGPGSSGYPVGVDTIWTRPLSEQGLPLAFWPKMRVVHRIPPERLRRRLLMKRSFQNGVLQAVLERGRPSTAQIRWLLKSLVGECAGFLRGSMDDGLWLARHSGYLMQILVPHQWTRSPAPGWR
ncbi:glycosyltransferase family 2 protein [bacterium]|nr:glycosyltransferase family 2 protein [bacterium]